LLIKGGHTCLYNLNLSTGNKECSQRRKPGSHCCSSWIMCNHKTSPETSQTSRNSQKSPKM